MRGSGYRTSKYKAKLDSGRSTSFLPEQKKHFKSSISQQVQIELEIKNMVNDLNTVYYILFAKKVVSLSHKHSGQTLIDEIYNEIIKWCSRGLNILILDQIKEKYAPGYVTLLTQPFIDQSTLYWGELLPRERVFWRHNLCAFNYWNAQKITIEADANLSGCYYMNEQTWNNTANEVADSSGNANHGRALSGATSVPLGIGRCADFTLNNAVVQLSSTIPFLANAPWTFMCWLDWTDPAPDIFVFFAGQDNIGNNGFLLRQNTNYRFGIRNTGGVYGLFAVNSSLPYYNTGWFHVAFVANGLGQLSLYINGAFSQTINVATSMIIEHLGNAYFAHQLRYNGYMDEVGIYSRALGLPEINSIYQLGLARFGN